MLYCFLRRNLSKQADISQVISYINAFYYECDAEERLRSSKAYQAFVEDFLSNKFTVGV